MIEKLCFRVLEFWRFRIGSHNDKKNKKTLYIGYFSKFDQWLIFQKSDCSVTQPSLASLNSSPGSHPTIRLDEWKFLQYKDSHLTQSKFLWEDFRSFEYFLLPHHFYAYLYLRHRNPFWYQESYLTKLDLIWIIIRL